MNIYYKYHIIFKPTNSNYKFIDRLFSNKEKLLVVCMNLSDISREKDIYHYIVTVKTL